MAEPLRLRATYTDGKLVPERPLPELEGLELVLEVRLPMDASRQAEVLVETRSAGVEVRLGKQLAPLGMGEGAALVKHVRAFRKRLERASGLVLPRVRLQVSADLPACAYAIMLRGRCLGKGEVVPGQRLAVAQEQGDRKHLASLGCEVKPDPIFGLPSAWIGHGMEPLARKLGFTIVADDAVLAGHLEEALLANLGDCLLPGEMRLVLQRAADECPQLLQQVVPSRVSERELHALLAGLLTGRRRIAPVQEVLRVIAQAPPEADCEELLRLLLKRMPGFAEV